MQSSDYFNPQTANTESQDKRYVEPRCSLGHLLLRNLRVRRLGFAVLPVFHTTSVAHEVTWFSVG